MAKSRPEQRKQRTLYDVFSDNLCLVYATVYVAEHLTAIGKIYAISGLCCGSYLLALGHLSFFRICDGQVRALVQL